MKTIIERHIDLRHGARTVNDPAEIQGLKVPVGAVLRGILPDKQGAHLARLFFEVDPSVLDEKSYFIEVLRPTHRDEHAREPEGLVDPPEGVKREYLGSVTIATDLLDVYFLYLCTRPQSCTPSESRGQA